MQRRQQEQEQEPVPVQVQVRRVRPLLVHVGPGVQEAQGAPGELKVRRLPAAQEESPSRVTVAAPQAQVPLPAQGRQTYRREPVWQKGERLARIRGRRAEQAPQVEAGK